MRFTEHELTAALRGQDGLAAQRRDVRGQGGHRHGVGPVEPASALTCRSVKVGRLPGPTWTSGGATSTGRTCPPSPSRAWKPQTVGSLVEDRPGQVRRAIVVKARTALVQSALTHVPSRQDPDTLVAPDHL